MKRIFFLYTAAHLFLAAQAQEPVDYVNTQIGSISHLLQPTFNTVSLPNSMLRFVPVTSPGISDHYVASRIYGLALNQPAHRGAYLLSLMSEAGPLDIKPEALSSEYDHDFETTTPYYYSVLLEDDDIRAEFTPTSRCGFFRFTASGASPLHLVLKGETSAEFRIVDATTIVASSTIKGLRQYAFIRFSRPFHSYGIFQEETVHEDESRIKGDKTGVYVTYDKAEAGTVEVKYGISCISYDMAKAALQQQIPDWDFDVIKQNARQKWNEALSKIEVEGVSEDDKTVFYTAFYRTLERMVNILEDDQYYSAYDKKVHADNRNFYVDDWSWDTYRALHPLRVILNPDMEADMVQSYIRMYEQSGWMPSFPQVYGDMGAMIGHHQAAIIADAWLKGVRNFDIGKAYEGLVKNATKGTMIPWREGPATELDNFYRKNGYFPALDPGEKETVKEVTPFEKRQAVAVTLEHSYDDWCLAQLSTSLKHNTDKALFLGRALNYENVYNPETGFMSPKKADGTWVTPFDPMKSGGIGCRDYFAEINAWTYSFHVQHDVNGLISLMGGSEQFIKRLDGLYAKPMFGYARWTQTAQIPDGTGMVGQFVMGNEQSFHVPYLYVYAGAPWKAQKRVRMLMDTWFRNDVMGICGDEDGGAMSAWYIFSALGFYPVTPGMPVYVIGTPLFDQAVIHLPGGKTFTVTARNNSRQNKYIQSATLNGKPMDRAWFTHDDLVSGGKLVFQMGPRPNKKWGTEELPPSFGYSVH